MTSLTNAFSHTFLAVMKVRTASRTKKCEYCGCRYLPLSSYSFCCEECKHPLRSAQLGRTQYRGTFALSY